MPSKFDALESTVVTGKAEVTAAGFAEAFGEELWEEPAGVAVVFCYWPAWFSSKIADAAAAAVAGVVLVFGRSAAFRRESLHLPGQIGAARVVGDGVD